MELQQNKFVFDDNGTITFIAKPIKQKVTVNKPPTDNKYQQLDMILTKIYDTLNIDLFETREIIRFNNIIAFPDERQAEVDGTQFLDIEERIKINEEILINIKEHENG